MKEKTENKKVNASDYIGLFKWLVFIWLSSRVECFLLIKWNQINILSQRSWQMNREYIDRCNQGIKTKIKYLLKFTCDAITMYEGWNDWMNESKYEEKQSTIRMPKIQFPFYKIME